MSQETQELVEEVVELEEQEEIQEEVVEESENAPEENEEVEDQIVDVTFDGEEVSPAEEKEEAPEWVKDLRKGRRDDKKRIKELEKQLQARETANEVVSLPEKPTLASCDYDEDVFEQKLQEYNGIVQKHESIKKKQQEAIQKQTQEFNDKLTSYQTKKQELRLPNFEEYEFAVESEFTPQQQQILINVSKNANLTVYALGKNESKLSELAQISDPVLFAAELARVEATMKTVRNSKKPSPEKVITSSGGGVSSDAKLDKLRAEAQRTGDFTKVHKYKKELRNK